MMKFCMMKGPVPCMVDANDFPSRFICISLPASAALLVSTTSSVLLVNLVEKDGACIFPPTKKGKV